MATRTSFSVGVAKTMISIRGKIGFKYNSNEKPMICTITNYFIYAFHSICVVIGNYMCLYLGYSDNS